MYKTVLKNLFVAILMLATISCGQSHKKIVHPAEQIQSEVITPKEDHHNASNSLDWAGTYRGTLPCADCEGIKTELILNQDYSYTFKTSYIGKVDQPSVETGTFAWNEAGNTITLSGAKNRPSQYFVAENKVIQLDMDGNKISGSLSENYILKKQ